MQILRAIELNQRRLRIYRRATRTLALLLAIGALYTLAGGMALLLSGGVTANPLIAGSGLSARPDVTVQQFLGWTVLALLAWSAGEYLGYVISGEAGSTSRGARLLPDALVAAALFPVALSLLGLAAIPFSDVQSSPPVSPAQRIFSSFLWNTTPLLACAAANIGLALAVRRLTAVIDEAKAMV